MASIKLSGTRFFWPNVSLESVERECKRNGDSYKAGYQDGVQGYWITVSKAKDSASNGKLVKPTTRHDHRIRSASPLPPTEGAIQGQEGKGTSRKSGSNNTVANKPEPGPNRRLSAVLLRALESSSVDDTTSIWENSTTGAQFEYVKGDILGKGSFGEVRKVSVDGYKGSVARKSMFLQSRNRRQIQKEKDRIKREVDNLQRVRHRHVVNILDCYAEQEKNFTTYYLIMSPVGEQDLDTFLDKFPKMSTTDKDKYRGRVSSWFTCLASALAYMHTRGVRHEDIKPSNIIHRGDVVYFTDFSSSRVFKPDFETATTSTVETTRRFAPPEVLDTYDDQIHIRSGNAVKVVGKDGKTTYEVPHGRQSDVFSLALVFAEMTTVFNRNIADMHAYVLVLENSKRKPLYHEVTERLGTWFTKELKSERGLKLWQCCLQAMLRERRVSRPSALDVVHTLQREQPVGKFKDDGCQALLPSAPKAKTATKPNDKSFKVAKDTQGERLQEKRQGSTASKDTDTAKVIGVSGSRNAKIKETAKAESSKAGNKKSDKPANGGDAAREIRAGKDQIPKKEEEATRLSNTMPDTLKREERRAPKEDRQAANRQKGVGSLGPQRKTAQAPPG